MADRQTPRHRAKPSTGRADKSPVIVDGQAPEADTDCSRRETLLLAVLRLSRDRTLWPGLEEEVLLLDSGRSHWSLPGHEQAVLQGVQGRLGETLAANTGTDNAVPQAPCDGDQDDGSSWRLALLLSFLKASRDPAVLFALRARVAALDDGRCPPADRQREFDVLEQARHRFTFGLDPVAVYFMEAVLPRGRITDHAVMPGRVGRVVDADFDNADRNLLGIAGDFLARMDRREPVDAGVAALGGWTLAARLGLAPTTHWHQVHLLAMLPPPGGGGELELVAVGGPAPEFWTWKKVQAEAAARRLGAEAAEAFVETVQRADPALPAVRREAARDAGGYLDRLRNVFAERASEERHGGTVVHLHNGKPVRVNDAVLDGGKGAGTVTDAWRVDEAVQPDRPWAEQVWIRSVGDCSIWRRGRLRPEPGRLLFVDEPGAAEPSCADVKTETTRMLEVELLASKTIRCKATASDVYARLLHTALQSFNWIQLGGSGVFDGRGNHVTSLVAALAGTPELATGARDGLSGLLDEEVVVDLWEIGWVPRP